MQKNGFAAEQGEAPEAILHVTDECQPRGAVGSRVARSVVLREHASYDILVDVGAEGMRYLLGDAYTAEFRVAALQFNDGRDEFCRRPFGAGFAATVGGGKEQAILTINQRLVEFEQRCRLDRPPEFWNPRRAHER